jgi:hypothetical protein
MGGYQSNSVLASAVAHDTGNAFAFNAYRLQSGRQVHLHWQLQRPLRRDSRR